MLTKRNSTLVLGDPRCSNNARGSTSIACSLICRQNKTRLLLKRIRFIVSYSEKNVSNHFPLFCVWSQGPRPVLNFFFFFSFKEKETLFFRQHVGYEPMIIDMWLWRKSCLDSPMKAYRIYMANESVPHSHWMIPW